MHLRHQPCIELAFKSLSFFTHSNPQRRWMENNNIDGFCRRVKLIINMIRQRLLEWWGREDWVVKKRVGLEMRLSPVWEVWGRWSLTFFGYSLQRDWPTGILNGRADRLWDVRIVSTQFSALILDKNWESGWRCESKQPAVSLSFPALEAVLIEDSVYCVNRASGCWHRLINAATDWFPSRIVVCQEIRQTGDVSLRSLLLIGLWMFR